MDAHESEDVRVRARVGSRATPTAYRVPRSQGGTDTHRIITSFKPLLAAPTEL